MNILEYVKRLPIDLGQGCYRRTTKAKAIAFSFIGKGGGRVLDLGCGDGYWAEKLIHEKAREVTAADFYDSRYGYTEKVNAEERLPYADNSFDAVWSAEVIEHVDNVDFLIQEMRRVVRNGGKLIITTPNSHFWLYYILAIFRIAPAKVQNPDHKQFFSYQDIRKLFLQGRIYGFFPYAILKFRISKGVSLLSPNFIVKEVVRK